MLEISFLTFSNTKVLFTERELIWRFYITFETWPTTKRIELIKKKKFAKVAIVKNVKVFIVHVTFLSLSATTMQIYQVK